MCFNTAVCDSVTQSDRVSIGIQNGVIYRVNFEWFILFIEV